MPVPANGLNLKAKGHLIIIYKYDHWLWFYVRESRTIKIVLNWRIINWLGLLNTHCKVGVIGHTVCQYWPIYLNLSPLSLTQYPLHASVWWESPHCQSVYTELFLLILFVWRHVASGLLLSLKQNSPDKTGNTSPLSRHNINYKIVCWQLTSEAQTLDCCDQLCWWLVQLQDTDDCSGPLLLHRNYLFLRPTLPAVFLNTSVCVAQSGSFSSCCQLSVILILGRVWWGDCQDQRHSIPPLLSSPSLFRPSKQSDKKLHIISANWGFK